MSSTMCILPLLAALFTAETSFIQSDKPWVATNPIQEAFLKTYWPHYTDELHYLKPEELKSRVSRNVSDINQFLKENGFSIALKDLISPDAMYLASIMNVLVQWKQEGIATTLKAKDLEYPAVKMSHDACFKVPNHQEVIFALETKSGDTVYMSIADKERSGFELLSYIKGLFTHIKNKNITREYFDKIIFPMIDINDQPDISWLVGMNKIGMNDKKTWIIMEALQQTKFQMNETGAAAQSAVAISMIESLLARPEKIHTIDRPFYVWIMRDGMELPLFAAYFDESSWKMPAKLG